MEITIHRHTPSSCRECADASIVDLRRGQRTVAVVLIKHASIPASDKHFSTQQESGRVGRATITHIPSGPESGTHYGYISNRILRSVLHTSPHPSEHPTRPPSTPASAPA